MTVKLKDFIEFNPKETLCKNGSAKKIAMDKLQSFCREIAGYEVSQYLGGSKFRNKDTIMARITPCLENGKIAQVNILNNNEVAFGSTEFIVLRAKKNIADPDYIYYLTISELIRTPAIKSMVGSSGRQRVQIDVLENLEIDLPDLATQKKIAKILSALDDKIECNNQINKNLEEQAKALFDNMFPDVFSGNKTVGDYVVPQRGKSLLSKDAKLGNVPVVAGGLEPYTYHNVANTIAPVITISASGANAGYVNLWHVPVWSSDSSFIDAKMTGSVYFWYILLKKRQQEIFDSQTGSAQPHIYPQHIAVLKIKELNQQEIKNFNDKVATSFSLIASNQAENMRLQQMRDTLLPKLMSGELDVSEIDI